MLEERYRRAYIIEYLPVRNEAYFFNQISKNSVSLVTFCTPRNVIDITEGIDQHDMRVSSLIGKVTPYIAHELDYEFSMSW